MQTYTHLLLGTALAATCVPHEPILQASVIIGSVVPDLVMVPAYVLDLIKGLQPLKEQGKLMVTLKKLSHSIPVSVTVGIISGIISVFSSSILPVALLFFGAAIAVHSTIDEFTHSNPALCKGETGFWPFEKFFEGSREYTGIWDYRYDHGTLWPKPFEAVVAIGLLCITGYYLAKSGDLANYINALLHLLKH